MTLDELVTFAGTTQSIREWALDYGIPAQLIVSRIQGGMRVTTAITRPMRVTPGQRLDPPAVETRGRKRILYEINGRAMTIQQWSVETGINVATIRYRLSKGASIASALCTESHASNGKPLKRGVSPDLPPFVGTGGGRTAQETSNMEFFLDDHFDPKLGSKCPKRRIFS